MSYSSRMLPLSYQNNNELLAFKYHPDNQFNKQNPNFELKNQKLNRAIGTNIDQLG